MSEMTLEQANKIAQQVAEQRIRWGKLYDGGEFGLATIMDAIVVIARAGNQVDADLRTKLTLSNRQLAAAKAREARYRKKLGLDTTDDADLNEGAAASEEGV